MVADGERRPVARLEITRQPLFRTRWNPGPPLQTTV